jgi:hypothetical protein
MAVDRKSGYQEIRRQDTRVSGYQRNKRQELMSLIPGSLIPTT